MKKHGIGSRLLALLLALAMVLPMMPLTAKAADLGTLANVDTGLTGDIDTNDTISLPIQILDYDADGMLFEYAESRETKEPADFGATYATDYTDDGVSAYTSTVVYQYTRDYSARLQNTGLDTQYMKVSLWSGGGDGNGTDYITYFNQSSYEGATGTTYKLNQIRYLVFVYRARSISSTSMSFSLYTDSTRYNNPSSSYKSDPFPVTMGTDWTYEIVDLYSTGASASTTVYGILMDAPITAGGNYIDIAYAAYFANEDQAKAFAEYALTKGSDNGDNRAFGLLRGSRTEFDAGNASNGYGSAFTGIFAWDGAKDTVKQVSTYVENVTTVDFSTVEGLGYKLLGTFRDNGIANVGLLQSTLVNGKPVYKKEVVQYVGLLLASTLPMAERTSDGWKNYRYIGSEMADKLRAAIDDTSTDGITNGVDYTAAQQKKLIGKWEDVSGNISTYVDAAYFLLNSLFIDSSYNTPQDNPPDNENDGIASNNRDTYDYLVLSAGTDSATGDKIYVFDGGFSTSSDPAEAQMAIDYNTTNHTIQNTSAAGKAHFYYESESTTTLNPFLPITDMNNADGYTKTPYYQDDGIINGAKKQVGKDTNYMRDYNFAMYSSGEFVYHADEELFFDFEGDDDVYLFINDELVMDIGSAHSIDGVRIELNDYVEAAKAGTLGSDERNKRLALVEGDTYNFDFFYMERHTYGSNMRISTNIRVTDPSMTTDKTAYVDGVQVEYGGIVNAGSIVEYGFKVTNEGGENLYNIGFTDNDIGVKLDPENGLTITGSRVYSLDGTKLNPGNTADRDKLVKELTAVLTGENRETGLVYDPITVKFADNEALKAFLKEIKSDAAIESGGGLWKGSAVAFRGIGYKLSDGQILDGWFDNTVFATATNKTGSKTLKSQDTMRVCVPSDPMYYQWAGHDLQISLTKLIDDINAAANQEGNALSGKVSNLTAARVTNMVEITKGGYGVDYPQITVNSDFSLNVKYTTVGSYVFYVKIYYKITDSNWPSVSVPIVVNVTDVKPSVFVLDYGLKADLTEKSGKELFKNDTLSVPGRDTATTILAMGTDGAYGSNEITIKEAANGTVTAEDGTFSFDKEAQKLLFTPTDFMEGTYTTQIAVNVYEKDITPSRITGTLDINNEVEMFKPITVLPATVVYYEDDFPAITYYNDGNEGGNVFTPIGSSKDNTQGVDQDENYGYDDSYAADDEYSGDSLTKITIRENGLTARFTFKGTGFELISRTNAYDSASIMLAVFKDSNVDAESITYVDGRYYNGDIEVKPERMVPVITEFDNGANGGAEEIYQVPVIRVDDLPLDTYTVVIRGTPAYDLSNVDMSDPNWRDKLTVIDTILYVDGLRIFRPLGPTNDNYTADEDGAAFTEVRDLILEGKAAVATYDGTNVTVSTGTTTWTENRNNTFEGNEVSSIEEYLLYGPNNEVYMDGAFSDTALAFQVTETGTGTHALQVAIHAVDQGLFYGAGSTDMHAPVYYATAAGTWQLLDTITSGVEMYYTIDYTKCPVSNGAYQIILKVDIGDAYETAMASYTTIKTVGLEIGSLNRNAATLRYYNGMLEEWDGTKWVPTQPTRYDENGDLQIWYNDAWRNTRTNGNVQEVDIDGNGNWCEYRMEDGAPEVKINDEWVTIWEDADSDVSANASYPDFLLLGKMLSTSVMAAPEQPKPVNPFVDAEEGSFYYDAMLWAVENGITNGTSATTFSPGKQVSRAETVTFLWRAAGQPEPTVVKNPFVDVNANDFYYKAVLWAVEKGITNGMDATHFGPYAICNRAQVVTFLWRAAEKPEHETAENPFRDAEVGSFYYDAMLWAVENGITNGIDANNFGPAANCNRAQIVTFLYRAQ